MIPKKIHYCWFGGNKKSKLILDCIASWKRFFPDYEIIEWNEDNFDVYQCDYIKQAYKQKKWAYVSDYARMKILDLYGGIYFDTDVEVVKNFPEELREYSFSGIEEFSKLVAPGLVYGCEAGDVIVHDMVEEYEKTKFDNSRVEDIITINKRITKILEKYGYIHEDVYQDLGVLRVYPSEFFCAYDGKQRRTNITEKTLATHHYTASWLPWYRKIRLIIGTKLRHMGFYL